jgi:hypothetical protein
MTPEQFEAFTAHLTTNLQNDSRVIGLVALGSMAQQDYQPDEFSDHDFFVVTVDDKQEHFRQHFDWLPNPDQIVYTFRETQHGVKVLYNSGHLLEYAVFNQQELFLAKVNRYRVLLDRATIAEDLAKIEKASVSEPPDRNFLFGNFITHLFVGVGRYALGEKLSGYQFVQGFAVNDLLQLIPQFIPSPQESKLDNLNANRRFELVYPELGAELNRFVMLDSVKAAAELMALAERILKPHLSEYPEQAVAVLRDYIKQIENITP